MTIKNVVVAGGGVLGSQIAYQAAYKGFAVTVWLRSEGSVERAKPKFEQLRQTYLATLEAMKIDPAAYCRGLADTPELSVEEIEQLKQRAQQAFEGIVFTTSYEAAAKDADLVIEAIAEDPKQKDAFYAELAKYLPESTILVTNSSTLLPSQIAASTGRPEKFLALHFANRIWRNNTAEVMGHPGTDQAAYDEVVRFAADLGMVPLQLHKEQPGYILNSMLVPFLNAAEAFVCNRCRRSGDHRQNVDAGHGRAFGSVPYPRYRGPYHGVQHRGARPAHERPRFRSREDRGGAQGTHRRRQNGC